MKAFAGAGRRSDSFASHTGKHMKPLFALALSLAAAAPAFAQAVDPDRIVRPYWWDKPVIESLGRSMMEVQPNRATFTVAFVETDANSGKAMESAVARAKVATEAVKKIAGDRARAKTSVNVEPYYEQYRDKDGNIQTNDRADRVKGYEARAQITVTLTDIALAGRARAAALALGPQDSNPITFSLEQTVEMQRDAMKLAAQDARLRAEVAATAAGGRLGDVVVLQEGQGPCLGSWSSRQMARATTGSSAAPSRAVEVYSAQDAEKVVVTGSMVGGRRVEITEGDIQRLDLPSDNDPVTIPASVCVVYLLNK